MSTVGTERQGDIAVIRLERPPVNAMDEELLRDLILAVEAFGQSDARAAILTSSGRSFCAGVDLRRLVEGGTDYVREFLPLLQDCFATLFTVWKPVVAAVNGHALAGGCILAAACDVRLMASGPGTIGVTELPVGLPFPSWALEVMRYSTAHAHLHEVVLTGRRYTPEEALHRGLLDEVVAPEALMERAMEVAVELAAVHGPTFAHTKRQLRQPTLDRVERHGPDFNALAEAVWASEEGIASVRAYLGKAVGRASAR